MGLADELIRRVERLLDPWDPAGAKATAKWLEENFRFKVNKTPSGQKDNKKILELFWWGLNFPSESHVRNDWPKIKPLVPELVAKFTAEGGADVPAEVEVNGVTYRNPLGLSRPALMKMVAVVDAILKSLQGWRRKALAGHLNVSFAGPDAFRGSAKGRYNAPSDTMFVRATPSVIKRSGAQYGSFEYIFLHELGHRYERVRRVHMDFGTRAWETTPYSEVEGMSGHSEAFAELFALGHFNITSWGPREFGPVIEKFEALMTAGKAEPAEEERPEGFVRRFEDLGVSDKPEAARVASRFLQPGVDPVRVAFRFLESTFQAPRVIRRKEEAEELVRRFTTIEREILRHLHRHGSVTTMNGSHVTLGPQPGKRNPKPSDYKQVQSGLLVVRDLERTKWLRKTANPAVPHAFNWLLTREAESVFRLTAP